jgi:hypothetical protein
MADQGSVATLEKGFRTKLDAIDPAIMFEAYARVVPVLTANLITTADTSSGRFLATLIFKQVAIVEKTLKVPGLLDYVADTTETLVYNNHGVKRGEALTLTGGNGNDLALVSASGASAGALVQQTMDQRRQEEDVEAVNEARELAKLEREAKREEAKSRLARAQAATAEANAYALLVAAQADKVKRESTLIGQVFTPENVGDAGISSLFSGAVMLASWTSLRIAGKVAIGTAAAAGGLVQAGAREVVVGVSDVVAKGGEKVANAVGNVASSINPFGYFFGTQSAPALPSPEPVAPVAPAAESITFFERAGQNADTMSSGLLSLLQLPFRQVSVGDSITLVLSMFVIITIAMFLVIKVGRKAFAKESSLVDVLSAMKGNPKIAQQDNAQLRNVASSAPALANAPPPPAPALANTPAPPPPALALANTPANTSVPSNVPAPPGRVRSQSVLSVDGGRKRRTFRKNKRRATRHRKATKVMGAPVFIY